MSRHLILFLLLFNLFFSNIKSQETTSLYNLEIEERFIEAKKLILIDEDQKALTVLEDLYKKNRSNASIAFELSNLYQKLNDIPNCLNFAKIASKLAPDNIYFLDRYGSVCILASHYNDAITAYANLLKNYPSNEYYTDQLTLAYSKISKYDDALRVLNNFEKHIGVNIRTSQQKFEILTAQNKMSEAIAELVKLLKFYPNNLGALHSLASSYSDQGLDDKAVEIYKKIIAVDINDTKANIALMEYNSTNSSDDSNYLRALLPIIENESVPLDTKIKELIPFVTKLTEHPSDIKLQAALLLLTERLATNYNTYSETNAIRGDVLYLANRYTEAIESYKKALSFTKSIYEVWQQLMILYEITNDFHNLETISAQAVDYFPNKASAYYFYGIALVKNNNSEKANTILNEGLIIAGSNLYNKVNIKRALAENYILENDLENALKHLDQALKLSNNNDLRSINIKIEILKKQGNEAEAQKWEVLSNSLISNQN